MSDPFIGEIRTFGFDWAPKAWAQCNGQLLAISQNQALYALIGTTYGGNGVSTFALPNLRGRSLLGFGQAPGQPNYEQGQAAGTPTTTLVATNLPIHAHTVQATATQPASSGGGGADTPLTNIPANSGGQMNFAAPAAASGSLAPPAAINQPSQPAGSNQPIDNMPPYLVLNFCIALQGIFPSRS